MPFFRHRNLLRYRVRPFRPHVSPYEIHTCPPLPHHLQIITRLQVISPTASPRPSPSSQSTNPNSLNTAPPTASNPVSTRRQLPIGAYRRGRAGAANRNSTAWSLGQPSGSYVDVFLILSFLSFLSLRITQSRLLNHLYFVYFIRARIIKIQAHSAVNATTTATA